MTEAVEAALGLFSFWPDFFLWMAAFFVAFAVLCRITPCNPGQALFKRAFLTDAAYYFFVPVVTRLVRTAMLGAAISVLYHGVDDLEVGRRFMEGHGPMGALPVWLQAAIIFLVSDVILYWIHRGFHGRLLWPFHAIHHSPTEVEWHSTYRFHPVNLWLSFTLVDVLVLMAGFSLPAVAAMGVFNMLYSAMVHANLNWTFGPFKYAFASPVFHRWHHTAQAEGLNKNFAPTFPLLDIMFGTFYMPDGRVPETYGAPGMNVPESFWRQIIFPFLRKAR